MDPKSTFPKHFDLVESYNRYARERDGSQMQDWKITVRAKFLAALQQADSHTLLEIGSGPGRDGLFFQENGMEVICVDLSPVMVELCREKGLHAEVMDARKLEFPEASFDAIYCMNSLLHINKSELPDVLLQMDRLLKPGGLVYIGVYGGVDQEGIWEDDFYTPKRFFSFYTDEKIQQVIGQVFDIISFEQILPEPEAKRIFQSMILKKSNVSPS
jgi:ubiquinone/menaquinone biosynthesis C-methylase UbiE